MTVQDVRSTGLIDLLLDKAAEYLPPDKVAAVEEAYRFADEAHAGQFRKSGEPFIEHPLNTALYLADMRLDHTGLIAALLHDVVEDTSVTQDEISQRFGETVAKLVDGVTKLTQAELMNIGSEDEPRPVQNANDAARAASIRKMLMTMAEDVRVVIIKLADRLHNMRTLGFMPDKRRAAIAQETLDIYAPLAHRLGMWELKWLLEDLAFQHIEPDEYRKISRMLATKREERERYIDRVVGMLEDELKTAGIRAQVYGRPKHIYSIHRKTQKYDSLNRTVNDINDLFALRVIVESVGDCYAALGIVHTMWRPLQGEFDDYIASPKDNMYQSLHTAVLCEDASPVEIQIRTSEMHQLAEYGVAAHWLYKEGSADDQSFEEKMTWLRQILEWQREVAGAEEFVEGFKTDIFQNQVYVYTPQGDLKELPTGATPVDFAYRIHTDVGHRCIGAKVNGKLVPLQHSLEIGDTVEIVTSKSVRGPSRDWLSENKGYLKTSHARSKVRQWFNRQERKASVQTGREVFTREFRRLDTTMSENEIADLMGYTSLEEFLRRARERFALDAPGCRQADKTRLGTGRRADDDRRAPGAGVGDRGAGRRGPAHADGAVLQSHRRTRHHRIYHARTRDYGASSDLPKCHARKRKGKACRGRLGQDKDALHCPHSRRIMGPRGPLERRNFACGGRGCEHRSLHHQAGRRP